VAYLRVPKELISQFVKLCPTCQVRRGTSRGSPPSLDKSTSGYMDTHSSDTISPSQSRRQSVATTRDSVMVHSPLSMAGFSSTFQSQSRWMTTTQPANRVVDLQAGSSEGTALSSFSTFPDCISIKIAASSSTGANSNGLSSDMNYSNGIETSPTTGYPSNRLRAINGSHHTMSPNYDMKYEHSVKEEDHF
jgi:hypothetical protein